MANDVVKIGTAICEPGTTARGLVQVAQGADGNPLGFPVMIVNGTQPGKRLCVGAGIHGDEYDGQEAVRRLIRETDPKTLRGALIGLPCINIPAFLSASRSSYLDHLNLNRIFPGDRESTISMRWATTFLDEVVPNIDAFVDMHAGGGFGEIVPLTIVQGGFENLAMDLGLAIGHDVIWKGGKWGGTARISTLQAGKPAITIEIGGSGRCREEVVQLHLKGLRNAMKFFGLVNGEPERRAEYKEVTGTFARASAGGFYKGEATPGQMVKAGDIVARIVNHYGDDVEVIRAPTDGMVLWIRTNPTVHPGEETLIFGDIVGTIKP